MSEHLFWGAAGTLLALSMSALAWRRAHARSPGEGVYALDRRAYARYAAVFLGLAGADAAALVFAQLPLYVMLGLTVFASVFFGASFARGASDVE